MQNSVVDSGNFLVSLGIFLCIGAPICKEKDRQEVTCFGSPVTPESWISMHSLGQRNGNRRGDSLCKQIQSAVIGRRLEDPWGQKREDSYQLSQKPRIRQPKLFTVLQALSSGRHLEPQLGQGWWGSWLQALGASGGVWAASELAFSGEVSASPSHPPARLAVGDKPPSPKGRTTRCCWQWSGTRSPFLIRVRIQTQATRHGTVLGGELRAGAGGALLAFLELLSVTKITC